MKRLNCIVHVSVKPHFRIFCPNLLYLKGTVSTVNENGFGENFAKHSPNQSKNMTWVCLSIQLGLLCYCAATFEHGHFLCKIYWEFRMMFMSSVKMAFSTNFISASCVKLNKFNFVIFFKKVTKFILIMFTVTFHGEWIFHSIKECIPNWQVTGLSGLNGDRMFGFCLWGEKRPGVGLRPFNISQQMKVFAFYRCFECHVICFSYLGVKFKTVLWS